MILIMAVMGTGAAILLIYFGIKNSIKFTYSDMMAQLREVQAMDYKYLYRKIEKLEKRVADLEGKQQRDEKYFDWEAEAKNNNNQQ